eukprot:441537_1
MRDVVLSIVEPCYDWWLNVADPGSQKTKMIAFILKSVKYTWNNCKPYAEQIKNDKPEKYKRFMQFGKQMTLAADSFSGLKSEINDKDFLLWMDDEFTGRYSSFHKDGNSGFREFMLQMWNLSKDCSLNNAHGSCNVNMNKQLLISSNTQLKKGLAFMINDDSDGMPQRFSVLFSQLQQVTTDDIVCERSLENMNMTAVDAAAKKLAKILASAMKYHWFNDVSYELDYNKRDVVSAEHERIRALYLCYLNKNKQKDDLMLKKSDMGYARLTSDLKLILNMDHIEAARLFISVPPEGLDWPDFAELIVVTIPDMGYDIAQITKRLKKINNIGVAQYESDERVDHFDEKSPLYEVSMDNMGETPHSAYCEAFNAAEYLKYNNVAGVLTKICSNKLALKILRLIPVISVFRQCIQSHQLQGDNHDLKEFENPIITDCISAADIYKNMQVIWQEIDKQLNKVKKPMTRRPKSYSLTPPPVTKTKLRVRTTFDKLIGRLHEHMDGDKPITRRQIHRNICVKNAAVAVLDKLEQCNLIKNNAEQDKNPRYSIRKNVILNNEAAIAYFADNERDYNNDWIQLLGLNVEDDNVSNLNVEDDNDLNDEQGAGDGLNGEQGDLNVEENDNGLGVNDLGANDLNGEVNENDNDLGAGDDGLIDIIEIENALGADLKYLAHGPIINIAITAGDKTFVDSQLSKLQLKTVGDGEWIACMKQVGGCKPNGNWGGYRPKVELKFFEQIQKGEKYWDTRTVNERYGHPYVGIGKPLVFICGTKSIEKEITAIFLVVRPKENIKDFGEVKYYKNKDIKFAIMYLFK